MKVRSTLRLDPQPWLGALAQDSAPPAYWLEKLAIPYQGSGIISRRSFITSSPTTVENVLRGLLDSVAFIRVPANKSQVIPRHPLYRTRAHLFKKLMDEYIHPACIVFTFATANRAPLASLSKEQRDAQLAKAPLQRQSECKRAAVEEGIGSPMGKEATKSFAKLLKWIEESTERGPWLAGPDFSLADIAATPYMVRLEMLKLSRMWDYKPGVVRWWERVKARPSYETAITKWLRPQDIARYEKLTDPWVEVSKNLAAVWGS